MKNVYAIFIVVAIILGTFMMLFEFIITNIFPIIVNFLTSKVFFYIVIIILFWKCYELFYYRSNKFNNLKESIKEHIGNCNELNKHIEDLKNTYIVNVKRIDFGEADYVDYSSYNYKRPNLKKIKKAPNVYNCSLQVCKNAKEQPFKYICKYFDIKPSEESLAKFENILNDFLAAEQGIVLLKKERDNIIDSVSNDIPLLIQLFSKKSLIKNLGFEVFDFGKIQFPQFVFSYVSPGGNSSMNTQTTLNIENLERFIEYLSQVIKMKKSIKGQRALMTRKLREEIKTRDNYTCKKCGNSIYNEPNLLLEIDHIIPLSKNGLTTKENLQTLCWKCNRTKGAKVETVQ